MVNMVLRSEERPWGKFEVLYEDDILTVKRIIVKAGHRLSLQSHDLRDEQWTVESGSGWFETGQGLFNVRYGSSNFIKRGEKHRASAQGQTEDLVFIEVAFGTFDENDEVRYEDDYGRISPQ